MSVFLCDQCHPKLKECQGVHAQKTFGKCDGCGKRRTCVDCSPNENRIRKNIIGMYRYVTAVEYPRRKPSS